MTAKLLLHFILQYADLSVRLANPHELRPKPPTSQLSFGRHFTDHMLKIHYYEALGGWQAPEIMPFENIVLHPAAKVLHYAVEVCVSLYFQTINRNPFIQEIIKINS